MNNQYLDLLVSLESVFKRGGELALQMRGVASETKSDTGVSEVDLVTRADRAVQEFILEEMAKTDLRQCHLFAEEKTPGTGLFNGSSGLRLTLDPIDGTHSFVDGGRFFSVIVGLHSESEILYTFVWYPVVEWGFRVAHGNITEFGVRPAVALREPQRDASKIIAYTYGDPEVKMAELYTDIRAKGHEFAQRKMISDDAGSATLFYLGAVGGYYIGDPIVYDGLPALHFAQVKGLALHGSVLLTRALEGKKGPYYSGWYYVASR